MSSEDACWSCQEREDTDLAPRMQRMAAHKRQNEISVPKQAMIMLHGSRRFSARRDERCVRNVLVSLFAPPDVENIKGVKEACSTAHTRSS